MLKEQDWRCFVTGDRKAASGGSIEIKGINEKVAALLGATPDQILIQDVAVNPISRNVYLSVSRGRGPDAAADAADPIYLDVSVAPGKRKSLPLDTSRNAFAYVFAGSGKFCNASGPLSVPTEGVGWADTNPPTEADNRSLILFDSGVGSSTSVKVSTCMNFVSVPWSFPELDQLLVTPMNPRPRPRPRAVRTTLPMTTASPAPPRSTPA